MTEQITAGVQKFSWKMRLRSFGYAWEGILQFFRTEHNARIHLASSVCVILLCYLLPVTGIEMVVLLFSIALVWITEMINTAIEKTMDFIEPAYHPKVKLIKDLAAGAVLVASFAALITGIIVFIPKIISI